jgi:hypothetical protein
MEDESPAPSSAPESCSFSNAERCTRCRKSWQNRSSSSQSTRHAAIQRTSCLSIRRTAHPKVSLGPISKHLHGESIIPFREGKTKLVLACGIKGELAKLIPDPEIRESSSSSSSCSSSIYWASAPRKEPIFLAIILFRLCDGEMLEEHDISACALSAPASSNTATGHEARDIARRTNEVLAEITSKHRRAGTISREKLAGRTDQLTPESAMESPPIQSSHKETSFRSIELLQG